MNPEKLKEFREVAEATINDGHDPGVDYLAGAVIELLDYLEKQDGLPGDKT